jgi:plastocyanin domain-containing protein
MSKLRLSTIALAGLVGGLSLGCHRSAEASPEPRVVQIQADGKGFTPSHVEAAKGEKVTLRFVRTTDSTCAKRVVFPEIKVDKELPLDQPVDIEVPTDQQRRLSFQCGMGMYKSSVLVN